ncbi:hypothetical protein [Salipiger mucosus]|uniref:Uncharacterized protein n=1 Tax=Salipiger mucosus DSM 16094 TaxID=1123237 RepID=S9RF70_9RHOB|nr:hypothetical protein [Salipiger mucosus]EPX76760.1 hypothetical protein Salmuc_04646 [Salipiger mucosus DSM 16094]
MPADREHHVGQIILFQREGDECGLDEFVHPGMRARVLSVRNDTDYFVTEYTVDFGEFEQANTAFETASFYDANGMPSLTAREAGQYREQTIFYVQDDLNLADLGMQLIDDDHPLSILPQAFSKTREYGESYVAWLERSLVNRLEQENWPEFDPGGASSP